MREIRAKFSFNTALYGVNPDNGGWLEDAHHQMGTKIRAHMMSQPSGDGITNMKVYRHEMEVEFSADATSLEQVVKAVDEAIAWAANNLEDAFPLRGDKTVAAILTSPLPTKKVEVIAFLPTNLYAYPASSEDEPSIKREVADKLLQCDGVRGYEVWMNAVVLVVDTGVISVDDVKAHIQSMLDAFAADTDSPFLPFIKGEVVEVDWRTKQVTS